jgi:hypothetical protein
MANKNNPMLAKIEAKYQREYEAKLLQAKLDYELRLDIALQQSSDAALMAVDDVFDVNAYSAEKFHKAHMAYMDEISHMAVVEDKDDPDMEWTKATVDRRLLQIVGEQNFVPWDERYLPTEGGEQDVH